MEIPGSANKLRLAVLLTGLTCLVTGIFWLTGEVLLEDSEPVRSAPVWFIFLFSAGTAVVEDALFAYLLIFLGLILISQWLLLRPRSNWQVQLAETGRPMKTAVLTAAFLAMLLTGGLILTLLEIFKPDIPASVYEGLDGSDELTGTLIVFYITGLVIWAFWAIVFFIYWQQGEHINRLQQMINGLIAGSFIELFVAIGVYAWNPQEEDCWCARGSYTGLVFGATVMIWSFGPGLLLLFLKKQRERQLKQENRNS